MKLMWNGAGGFIRMQLNESTRFHIYHPLCAPFIGEWDGGIHDHRFRMQSRLLMGSLTHHWYDVVPLDVEGVMNLMWTLDNDDFVNPVPVHIHKHRTQTLRFGDDITFGGIGDFHWVEAHDLTVTCVTKIEEDDEAAARVITTGPNKPLNAFDPARVPSENMMLSCVREAFDKFPILRWSETY